MQKTLDTTDIIMANYTSRNDVIDDFIFAFRKIARSCKIFPGQSVSIEVLINPASGYFKRKRAKNTLGTVLREYDMYMTKERAIREDVSVRFHETTSFQNLSHEVRTVIETLASDVGADYKILVLAGGDGFHKDVGQAVMMHNPALFEDIHFLRLPLGTGNDTSDVSSLKEICELFLTEGATQKDSAIKVDCANGETHYAFNVVSFGLDAYISKLTNTFKSTFRGDVFKLMVDFATLFFDLKYRTEKMNITLTTSGEKRELAGRYMLTVLGKSGRVTYGGNKRILPGSDNFLLTDYIGVPKRILLKNRFMRGEHTDLSITHFYTVSSVQIRYPRTILIEMDGEVLQLEKRHFPVTLTVLPECLNVVGAG